MSSFIELYPKSVDEFLEAVKVVPNGSCIRVIIYSTIIHEKFMGALCSASIEGLIITSCDVQSLRPLRDNDTITFLSLECCQLSDLRELEGNNNIKRFCYHGIATPLLRLPLLPLEELCCHIHSSSGTLDFSSFKRLKRLYLTSDNWEDIQHSLSLTNLEELSLISSHLRYVDFAPLLECVHLKHLDIRKCSLSKKQMVILSRCSITNLILDTITDDEDLEIVAANPNLVSIYARYADKAKARSILNCYPHIMTIATMNWTLDRTKENSPTL